MTERFTEACPPMTTSRPRTAGPSTRTPVPRYAPGPMRRGPESSTSGAMSTLSATQTRSSSWEPSGSMPARPSRTSM